MKTIADVVNGNLCHGCGACEYVCPTKAITLNNIFNVGIRPVISYEKCDDCSKCVDACSGYSLDKVYRHDSGFCSKDVQNDWGPILNSFEAWSTIPEERFNGSSGGICTAIGRYCIEEDFLSVLHIRANPNAPLENIPVLSRSVSELNSGSGSRYAPAALCSGLSILKNNDSSFVVIGKPCDISAINKIRKFDSELDKKISLTISIFCGGTPSSQATDILVNQLNSKSEDVIDLRYRGYGWPGNFSVATRHASTRLEMSYEKAWGSVLTKHKAFRCNMCPDGTGESADISVGDAWFRKISDGYPGSSLVLVRTERGQDVISSMENKKYITLTECDKANIYTGQKGLLNRQRHVFIKIFWLRMLFMTYPKFDGYPLIRNYIKLGANRCFAAAWTTGRWFLSLKIRSHFPGFNLRKSINK